MSDIQKVLKTLEMSEAIAERCVLTCVDCGNLNEHIYNLNQRIAELEAYIDELENPQSIQDACICEDNPQDDRAGLYIDPDCPVHGEAQDADKSAECTHEGEVKDELLAK
jgi:hypothetical protein